MKSVPLAGQNKVIETQLILFFPYYVYGGHKKSTGEKKQREFQLFKCPQRFLGFFFLWNVFHGQPNRYNTMLVKDIFL